ncbi:MAG: hypothetical protein V2A34_01035 [Lentisphaerota bacterium]
MVAKSLPKQADSGTAILAGIVSMLAGLIRTTSSHRLYDESAD